MDAMDHAAAAIAHEAKHARNEDALVRQYMGLAKATAERTLKSIDYGLEPAERESDAMLGLIRALRTYDESKSMSLSSWVINCVQWAVMDGIRLRRGRKGQPRFDLEIRDCWQAGTGDSRGQLAGANNSRNGDEFCGDNAPQTAAALRQWRADQAHQADVLDAEEAMRACPAGPLRDVLRMYFFDGMTMAEIGRRLDISESRVSILLKEAREAVREQLAALRQREAAHA